MKDACKDSEVGRTEQESICVALCSKLLMTGTAVGDPICAGHTQCRPRLALAGSALLAL